jgi:hypothetical protein
MVDVVSRWVRRRARRWGGRGVGRGVGIWMRLGAGTEEGRAMVGVVGVEGGWWWWMVQELRWRVTGELSVLREKPYGSRQIM